MNFRWLISSNHSLQTVMEYLFTGFKVLLWQQWLHELQAPVSPVRIYWQLWKVYTCRNSNVSCRQNAILYKKEWLGHMHRLLPQDLCTLPLIQVNPFGVVPKCHQPNKWFIIVDLYFRLAEASMMSKRADFLFVEQLWRFRLVNLSMGLHLMEYTVPSCAWCGQILDGCSINFWRWYNGRC